MKLRITYFCRQCNEEDDDSFVQKCSYCGYSGTLDESTFYEWKVPVTPPFKKINPERSLFHGYVKKAEKPDEPVKIVSKRRRKVSAR